MHTPKRKKHEHGGRRASAPQGTFLRVPYAQALAGNPALVHNPTPHPRRRAPAGHRRDSAHGKRRRTRCALRSSRRRAESFLRRNVRLDDRRRLRLRKTPGIVLRATASPELVTPETGFVVEQGDVDGVLAAIAEIRSRGKAAFSAACRARALACFDKRERWADYLSLYESA